MQLNHKLETLSGGICAELVKSCIELVATDVNGIKDGSVSKTALLWHFVVPGLSSLKSKILESPSSYEQPQGLPVPDTVTSWSNACCSSQPDVVTDTHHPSPSLWVFNICYGQHFGSSRLLFWLHDLDLGFLET